MTIDPRSRIVAVLLLASVLLASPSFAAIPADMNVQGYLETSAGTPANGTYTLTLTLYPTKVGGSMLFQKVFTGISIDGGLYGVVLKALPDDLFSTNAQLWLETKVDTEPPLPRQPLLPTGYAFHARSAETASAAGGLSCSDCVGSAHLEADLALGGDLQVQGSAVLCDGGAGTCTVQLNNSVRFMGSGTTATVQASGGLRVRNGGDTGWAALKSGAITANGNVTVKGNLTVTGTISGAVGAVPWAALTGVPAGFADGVDDDEDTTYGAGLGVVLASGKFSADMTYLQRRVPLGCSAGEAIRKINADGSVVCGQAGQTYTAAANGGLQISGSNEISLVPGCSAGQVLKSDGTKWSCQTDATGGVTSFSQLTGSASDAQIPNNITINWAKDADKVDGHHYSAVWDSTDAQTLGGHPASYFATKAEHDALADSVVAPPDVHQTICDASLPTNVCKKDVYMADTHTRDANSLAALSGGTWVYYEAQDRCEYQGGVELDDPKSCGQDLMPGWMDTTDECGGFRRSTWDTRVRFAVAKDNKWDKTYNYTCPAGYHWATTQEVAGWFNGPNSGDYTYENQCGWQGDWWGGKRRYYFRLKDSATQGGAYKDVRNRDAYTLQYGNTTSDFAGIVCVQDAPPGPLDWMITEDDCGGFRQSTWDPRFYFAVSRKTVFDKDYDYQCPEGFHWASTAEGYEAFNTTLNQGKVYQNQCGWSGYEMHSNGLVRYYFRFSDSFGGATTLAHKHAGNGEGYTVQYNESSLSNFAGIVCKIDAYTPTSTDWMDTSDYCGGFRQSTWDPRFRFAVAKKNVWEKNKVYACPTGYHWASTAEVDAAHPSSNPDESPSYLYHNQCGWSAYTWNGLTRRYFRMSDSKANNRYMHAGHWDPYRGSTNSGTADFAGIVCKKDGTTPYPNPGTLDWMQTDDDCGGFRQSSWDSRVRYAIARQNVWDKNYAYTCPSGYHWGTRAEVDNLLKGPNSSYYKYNAQCGWSGSKWHGRNRRYFRFSDSKSNNGYLDTNHGDPYKSSTTNTTATFAGIVCVADAAPTDPLDWMDRTDNCGGFRESRWDTRVHYAVAKQNVWDKNKTYSCPTGYHWMSSVEAQQVFDGSNEGATRVYYSQCGWNGYNWHGLNHYYFRFSDSKSNNTHKEASGYDPRSVQTNSGTSNFAGIVCMQDGAVDPLDWMDTTDNCGGFRQSAVAPDMWYAVSKSNVWDKNRVYTCPAGYRWATESEGKARLKGSPAYPYNSYHGQCGWSGHNWNDAWALGCNAYSNAGCGSSYLSPEPTMWQARTGSYESGCDECESYDGNNCRADGTDSGPDGKCGGINETHWREGQHLDDCYFSKNNFSGNPEGIISGSKSDHCKWGICCGDEVLQNVSTTRYYFRFKDSPATGAYKHAGNDENHVVQYSGTVSNFAGIICIEE